MRTTRSERVLFGPIGSRYERHALLVATNSRPANGAGLPGPGLDFRSHRSLVHHATIPEMNVESYRRRAALNLRAKPDPYRGASRHKRSKSVPAERGRPSAGFYFAWGCFS